MPDTPPQPDPREIYRAYVADWDRYVAPAGLQAVEYVRLAAEYGKLALQSAFILNGGAIIALAPLVQSTHGLSVASLAPVVIWFVAGLALSAMSTALAYYNHTVIGETIILESHSRDFDLRANYGFGQPASENPEAIKVEEKLARRRPLITATMILSVAIGAASYGAFVFGAVSAANRVAAAAQQPHHISAADRSPSTPHP